MERRGNRFRGGRCRLFGTVGDILPDACRLDGGPDGACDQLLVDLGGPRLKELDGVIRRTRESENCVLALLAREFEAVCEIVDFLCFLLLSVHIPVSNHVVC